MSEGTTTESALWVITSYFNSMRYERRLANFRRFRSHLGAPLAAVELSYDGRFELGRDDADILVQLCARDVMWQKERLLCLALRAVPPTCTKVAWVDADVLFSRDDWAESASEALDRHAIVQLFREVRYLGRDWDSGAAEESSIVLVRRSLVSGPATGTPLEECLVHPSPDVRPGTYATGLAWAARRELLDRFGFYDANIAGGGDRAMACAALGSFEHASRWQCHTDAHRRHYHAWARRFHDGVRGDVGFLDADIRHLWHGEVADRGLTTRHAALRDLGYDPDADVALAENGCWRWSSEKPELRRLLRAYFASRNEDGRALAGRDASGPGTK